MNPQSVMHLQDQFGAKEKFLDRNESYASDHLLYGNSLGYLFFFLTCLAVIGSVQQTPELPAHISGSTNASESQN